MKLRKKKVVHSMIAFASLCTLSVANAQTPANCPMVGQASITHDQESNQGTLTTSTGDPRPLSFGNASFTLNAARTALIFNANIYNVDVTGTQTPDPNDNLMNAHIHVGAPPGSNAPVRWGFFGMPFNDISPTNTIVIPFATGVGGYFSGIWDLPEGNGGTNLTTNLPGIIAGLAYINFHTVQFPGGEIRGQIYLFNQGACGTGSLWYRDWDGDGFGDPSRMVTSVSQPGGYVANNLDCNDYKVSYEDKDNDGHGSMVKIPCGWIYTHDDCDDNNKRVHSPQTFYRDVDGDSWGDAAVTTVVCSSVPPSGYVANKMDCNDNDKMIRYCPPTIPTVVANNREGLELQMASLTLAASPNPFAHQTRIQYNVPVDAQVSIKVYDVLGREVNTVFNGQRSAGAYTQDYNATKLPSGLYYLRMIATANGKAITVQSQKLVKAE